ncbi:HD domain-containing protein [Flindersiella endophytica]
MIDTLEAADRLAERLHQGQVDKAGEPYIEHPRGVARLTALFGGTLHQQLAALLHDVVEDTGCTLDDLRELGTPEPVVELVDALSKRPGESRDDYLARVVAHPGAILVKRADLASNSDPVRLAKLPEDLRLELERKYAHTLDVLNAGSAPPSPQPSPDRSE